MRPRLTRYFCLTLLALSLLALAYFPLSHIRAASAGATILPSAAKPLVNLKNPQTLKVTYSGEAASALNSGNATPVSLASADFNADGAPDVVAGYSTAGGGVLAVFSGNVNAYAPADPTLYPKAIAGNVANTFQSKAATFTLPESPDFLVTGDFNRDGHQDVLAASRGGNLYFLAGDGTGNLLPATAVPVLGQVHALAAAPGGYVAVSLETANSEELAVLAPSTQGLTLLASYTLPARGDSIAWGMLGGGADIAVGAGSNIAIIYNAITPKAQSETVAVPFNVRGVALGDYIWDQDSRTEIAALADDGSIQILQHGTLNTAPLTAAQIPARRAAFSAKNAEAHAKQPSNPTALGKWTIAKQLPGTVSAPSGPVSASAFNSPRLAATPTHDVMVLDSTSSRLNIFDTSGKAASPSAGVSFNAAPVAALALPQKINASRDIVVLTSSQSAPMLVTANSDPTYNVTTTTDEDPLNACAQGSTVTTGGSPLSLREAICEANNAGGTSTINVPAGTYQLTIKTYGGGSSEYSSGELQVGITSGTNITISGAGAGSTIIQQTDNVDRLIEQDEEFNGSIPVTIQNLTLQNGICNDTSGLDCSDNGGGAVLGGGPSDNLTITNVTMNNNESNPATGEDFSENGGAVTYSGGTLTVTGSTFTGNKASASGGAIEAYVGDNSEGNPVASNFSVTNSTFTNNQALTDTYPSNGGQGGALDFNLYIGDPGSVTGSTFTGNQVGTNNVEETGGAIAVAANGDSNENFSMSNSRISGNTAPGGGTGMYFDGVSVTINNNWWGCNGGPGASGCNSVDYDDNGTLTNYTPSNWLVLSISANSTQIDTNSSTGVTADLNTNSSGGTGVNVPNGTPISFGATLGTISGASSTLTSGVATGTFNSGSTAGAGSATATVDNQEVSVTINVLVSVTVTTSPANLSFTVDGTTYTAPQTFNWVVGSSHTIATTSPQNVSGGTEQVFSSWSDGGPISHSVSAPSSTTTYTATFTTEYQLTTQASPSGDGTVTPTSGQYFASGASIPVTATPNTDFAFNNWTSTGGSFGSTTSASTTFTMPAAVTTVTGNFVPATSQITITTNPPNLLVSADGGSFVAAPLVETWNQGSTHTIATTSPQSGGTGIQYVWISWSDNGVISHSITVPTTATTYTASFATQYQLATAANPSIGGSVTPTSGNYYNSGTVVPLTATPNTGYTFTNWTGNVANSTSASTTITMTAPQSVTANFSLIIVAAPTSTSVSSNNNPSFTTAPNNAVTFTATVTSNSTVNEGTVTFSDPANDFTCSGGNTVAVSNGQATCTTSFTTEGSRVITAAYSGTVNFQGSSGMLTQVANNHTVVNGNQFCNPNGPTLSSTAGAATPYPSEIFVTGLTGNINTLTVNLNNISSSDVQLTDLLLVGPTGAALIPFASVGDGSTISGVNITLQDSASSLIPGGSPLTSGSYKPTSITGGTTLVFPSPAPTTNASNYAATDGSATLTSQFGNTAPNGTWELFAMASGANSSTVFNGGWCVNISTSSAPTITSANNTTFVVGASGTFTVTTTGTPTPSITESGTLPSGVGFANTGNGTAILSGSPTQSGVFPITFTASNGVSPNAVQNFTLTVDQAPAITSGNSTTFAQNSAGTFTVTTTGFPTPSIAESGTLPNGVTFVNNGNGTGTLSGTPTQGGTFPIMFTASNGVSPNAVQNFTLAVTSAPVTITPSSFSFGTVYLYSKGSQTFTVQNNMATTLDIRGVRLVPHGPQSDYTRENSCPEELPGGQSCQITVYFYAEKTGVPTATLDVIDNAPGSPQQVSVSATVIDPRADFSPASLHFFSVQIGQSPTKSTTLSNPGSTALDISSISITGSNSNQFTQTNSCPSMLNPGDSCIISVTFTPTQSGPLSADVTVVDNAENSPQNVPLSGTGQ
jgi:hypothetical protein